MRINENNGKGIGMTEGQPSARAKRAVGAKAPETAVANEPGNESLEQKVSRLERELKDASLMRDFYNEMINVAEKQFNIPIRKKAGTRR